MNVDGEDVMKGILVSQSTEYFNFFFNGSTISWGVAFVGLTALVINLIAAGRRGWAWPLLALLLTFVLLLVRGGASLFREVASDYDGTGGWDSE